MGYSWIWGAILSGQTTCGLLIGDSIAIGFRCGQGKKGIPEEHENEREKAITAVNDLYNSFLKQFGSTECKTLSQVDFRKAEEFTQWTITKGWKQTCDVFLNSVIKKCIEMVEEGQV